MLLYCGYYQPEAGQETAMGVNILRLEADQYCEEAGKLTCGVSILIPQDPEAEKHPGATSDSSFKTGQELYSSFLMFNYDNSS